MGRVMEALKQTYRSTEHSERFLYKIDGIMAIKDCRNLHQWLLSEWKTFLLDFKPHSTTERAGASI
jgi:hypothetical protein